MTLHFRYAVKAINSEWDIDELGMSADGMGGHYRTFYIKSGDARTPTREECEALADYMGFKYSKGYFYKEVL